MTAEVEMPKLREIN